MAAKKESVEVQQSMREANVYTIPRTAPFLDSLARAILYGDLPHIGGARSNTLELTQMTLLLPTRRACRAMSESFLRVSNGKATLLPRIRPVGDIDEDLTLLWTETPGFGGETEEVLTIPPAVSDIERRLILTELVLKWSDVMRQGNPETTEPNHLAFPTTTPAQASALAGELMRLMDAVETEQVDLSRLADIVPETYSHHWQLTLNFLNIITEYWPHYLQERGLTSPMDRRNKLLIAEAERLAANPPQDPIIAAGATGSIPATAALLKVVATLPKGTVVLPGLDLTLDDESWDSITPNHPEHPQFGMKQVLDILGVDRKKVRYVARTEPNAKDHAKERLISELMRPAESTELWQGFASTKDHHEPLHDALQNVTSITAPTAQDEAEVVSLILRHAAETPGKTAALITPDRILGRRVSVRLLKWGLMVDDSAGRPLAKTVPGVFLDLVAAAVSNNFAPAHLMSLLKHPMTRLGFDAGEVRAAARALELTALRQAYLSDGLDAIRHALDRAQEEVKDGSLKQFAIRRLRELEWDRARDLLERLEIASQPLTDIFKQNTKHRFRDFVEAHIAVSEAIAKTSEGTSDPLWAGEAGETFSVFLANLLNPELPGPEIAPSDYPEFYRSLLIGQAMRPLTPVHPRLFIWGPMEARLQQVDVVILGGLNEGIWPQAAETDPWLSRPMREALGLPAPEQRIGLSAHDFAQNLGGHEVFLTRAGKIEGTPTVPSRWLLRLEALLKGLNLSETIKQSQEMPWLGWARARDAVTAQQPARAPAPTPPVEARPRRLSVTQIEDWIANPYAIYARHILKLEPLPKLGSPPDASLRGRFVHQTLHHFTQKHKTELPEDAVQQLVQIGDEILSAYSSHPRVAAFWRPRFERFAQWFVETERDRRRGIVNMITETAGKISFDAPYDLFTLSARADRIDICENGLALLYDYKTGAYPGDSDVINFRAPQLPLEAAIVLEGGFEELGKIDVAGLRYISAAGGEPPGQEHEVSYDEPSQLAAASLDGLRRLVARYDNVATPYTALRRPRFDYRYDDYAHLARVKAWAVGRDG